MKQIDVLTDDPFQSMFLKLEDGQSLDFSIWYSYNQSGWFYSFTYKTYTVNNRRLVNSGNMLRQIRNVVPFGLACVLTDKYEPVFLNDFKTGRATLYTLNQSDVATFEALIVG